MRLQLGKNYLTASLTCTVYITTLPTVVRDGTAVTAMTYSHTQLLIFMMQTTTLNIPQTYIA